jgi:predicted DNA-binding transcriptional regulator AlpA
MATDFTGLTLEALLFMFLGAFMAIMFRGAYLIVQDKEREFQRRKKIREESMKALLTIDEVCAIAGVSKPTVYRKVKLGEFPAPTKVPTTATRGPKLVNRWKKGAILDHVKAHSAAKAVANPPVEDIDKHWYESASKKTMDRRTSTFDPSRNRWSAGRTSRLDI